MALQLQESLAQHDWDLAISDHSLPSFSSQEALKTIRQNDANLPVNIVSGEIPERVAIQLMKAGAQDYVMKENLARLIPSIDNLKEAAGLKTIAEFVEDQATAEALKEIGVDFAQGFGIETPGPLN